MNKTSASPVERALIAKGLNGGETIIATDGAWLASDVEYIDDSNNEVGLCDMHGLPPGLYLFTGKAEQCGNGAEEDPYTNWQGGVRPVTMVELPELLAMQPPEVVDNYPDTCAECGQLAEHKDADGTPYCHAHRPRNHS